MKDDGYCRGDSDLNAYHIARGDNYSIQKIVRGIAQKYHIASRFDWPFFSMRFAFVIFADFIGFSMTVPPMDEFFKNEENNYSQKNKGGNYRTGNSAFKRLGYEMHERISEKRAYGKTNQNEYYAFKDFVAYRKKK